MICPECRFQLTTGEDECPMCGWGEPDHDALEEMRMDAAHDWDHRFDDDEQEEACLDDE